MGDAVNHPLHYNLHPSGVECIDIIEYFNFNCGNVIKYVWRAGLKGDNADIQDLKKAEFYIRREIDRRNNETRDQEKGTRESNINEHIESDWSVEPEGRQTDNEERSVPDSQHKLQHDKAWEDYKTARGAYAFCSKTESSESRQTCDEPGNSPGRHRVSNRRTYK